MKKFLDINNDNIHGIEDFCSAASKVTPPRPVLQPTPDPLSAVIQQMALPVHK